MGGFDVTMCCKAMHMSKLISTVSQKYESHKVQKMKTKTG